MKLARAHGDGSREEDTQIEWKEIFSRVKQDDRHGMNEWDKKDLEKRTSVSLTGSDEILKSFEVMKELGAGDERAKGA